MIPVQGDTEWKADQEDVAQPLQDRKELNAYSYGILIAVDTALSLSSEADDQTIHTFSG